MKKPPIRKENEIMQFAPPANGLLTPPYHHQIPPYGKLGDPYIITKQELTRKGGGGGSIDSGTYAWASTTPNRDSRFRVNWSLLQRDRLTEQLNTCFPFVYVISHCLWVLLNSIIQIALQIALMATNGALWWVGAGIWAGVYFIIMALLTLLLVRVRTYWLFILTYIMHIVGVLMAIGAYLVVNIIGIGEYRWFCSYYPNCFNVSVKVLSYLLFWFGVVLIAFLLVYIVLMPFWIMDIPNQCRRYREEKAAAAAGSGSSSYTNNNNQRVYVQDERRDGDGVAKHGVRYVQTNLDYDSKDNVYVCTSPPNVKDDFSGYGNYCYEQIG